MKIRVSGERLHTSLQKAPETIQPVPRDLEMTGTLWLGTPLGVGC